jgi:molecular chaperone GrpE
MDDKHYEEAGEATESRAESGAGEGDGADADAAGAADDLTEHFRELETELSALHDRHLRLAAEFDNYRKRSERERLELGARSQADLVGRLLDVLDDLQRVSAIDGERTTTATLLEGVQLVEKKLRGVLEAAGLTTVEAEGELFDPQSMEALMTVPAEHPEEDEAVADVFQKGYRFKDLLVRPARVRVKKYED